jgi:hypothetical protein
MKVQWEMTRDFRVVWQTACRRQTTATTTCSPLGLQTAHRCRRRSRGSGQTWAATTAAWTETRCLLLLLQHCLWRSPSGATLVDCRAGLVGEGHKLATSTSSLTADNPFDCAVELITANHVQPQQPERERERERERASNIKHQQLDKEDDRGRTFQDIGGHKSLLFVGREKLLRGCHAQVVETGEQLHGSPEQQRARSFHRLRNEHC